MLVSRYSRLNPRPWQRLVRSSSPSSTSTRCPRSSRLGASTLAMVDLPAPDRPVSQRTKPVSLFMWSGPLLGCGRDGGIGGRRASWLLPIGRDQEPGHLGPAELGRGQLDGGELGALLGAGQGDVLGGLVRAGLAGRHAAAAPAEEGVVEPQRRDAQLLGRQ